MCIVSTFKFLEMKYLQPQKDVNTSWSTTKHLAVLLSIHQ